MQLDPSPLERQTRLLEATAKVGHAVTSLLDLDALFGQIVDIICDTYNFYYAGVFLIDPHLAQYAVLRTARRDRLQDGRAGHRLEIADTSMIGWCINHKQRALRPTWAGHSAHRQSALARNALRDSAAAHRRGDVIGALTIQSAVENAFTEVDITTLQAMADQLAMAVENARLRVELEKTQRELAALLQR